MLSLQLTCLRCWRECRAAGRRKDEKGRLRVWARLGGWRQRFDSLVTLPPLNSECPCQRCR